MADILSAYARNARYGITDTNPADDAVLAMHYRMGRRSVALSDPRLVKILRLRLLGENWNCFELSYCYGQLADGAEVHVRLDRDFFTANYKGELIEEFKAAKKFAKGMGLFGALSVLMP